MIKTTSVLLLILSFFSCNLDKNPSPIYLVHSKLDSSLNKNDTIKYAKRSLKDSLNGIFRRKYPVTIDFENFIRRDDNCIGESYNHNSPAIYFYDIQLKTPIEFIDEAVLYFDDKEVDFKYCDGQLPNYIMPKGQEERDVEIRLTIADFEYNCSVSSLAFNDLKYLMFELNFRESTQNCYHTNYSNDALEEIIQISGNTTRLEDNAYGCLDKNIQKLTMVKTGERNNIYTNWDKRNNSLVGNYKKFNGTYKSILNETDFISFELLDVSNIILSVYNSNGIKLQQKGRWIYHGLQNSIEIDFYKDIRFVQNQDTISMKNYALLPSKIDSSSLHLTTYKIEDKKVKSFEFLKLTK